MKVGDLVRCRAVVSESPANLSTPAYIGVVIAMNDGHAEVFGGHDIDGIVSWRGISGRHWWEMEDLTLVEAR